MNKNKQLITMDNNLVRASYRLTVNELRLLLVVITQMPKDDEPLDPQKAYYVTKDDFVRLGCEPKNAAREIRSACRELLNRKITMNLGYGLELHTHWIHNILTFKTETFEKLKEQYPNAKNDDEFINLLRLHNLLDALPFVLKSNDNLMARIVFHENILPYISQLKRNFTVINPDDLAKFSSFYSYRVYFMLMQWRGSGKVVVEIDELKKRFEIYDKYKFFPDFKKRVLDVSVNEITEYTDYIVVYDLVKKGRKYTHVEFTFKLKEKPKCLLRKGEKREAKTFDIFEGLTDIERQTIQERIDEHIKRIENNGEIVSDFHRTNITKKAVSERWGIDVFEKKQRKKRLADNKKALEQAWNNVPNFTRFRHKTDGSIWFKEAGYLRNEDNGRVVPEYQIIDVFKALEEINEVE